MKSLFWATLFALLVGSSSALCETDDGTATAAPDVSPSTPADAAPPAGTTPDDAATETDQPTDAEDDKKLPADVMRHRPGACPEGPPCKEGD